ncbi:MAG: 2-phospho-L-lactate transferase [Solirubrobacteraceae bacterium]|nr:2-phospho-L-lactate transferase [Solirubrobacteraceae bacterium]
MTGVVLLSGGSGGAKLGRGLYDLVGERLTVIANTGDDIEIHGGHVSPDPDLIAYWLSGRIDARGWGIAGDTFAVMDGLRELGVEVWFNLGDRDLAVCIERRRLLGLGVPLSEALARLTGSLGLSARILPMTEDPVRTEIQTGGAWIGLQAFLIRARGEAPIDDVRFAGAGAATATPAAVEAIATAEAIIIGPSNPIISIGPILAVPGVREALAAAPAPVVAVSPIVGGRVLKGPTAACLAWAGHPVDADGIAAVYAGLVDGLVADEPATGVPTLETDTRMGDPAARRRLAQETWDFAVALGQ